MWVCTWWYHIRVHYIDQASKIVYMVFMGMYLVVSHKGTLHQASKIVHGFYGYVLGGVT